MAFPDDWDSIKNPENAIISTVTPIILNKLVIPGFSSTTAVVIPATQDYTVYLSGPFLGSTLQIEWSIDNANFTPFLTVFDNTPFSFTSFGREYIPRLSAGVFVRVQNTTAAVAGPVLVVLQ